MNTHGFRVITPEVTNKKQRLILVDGDSICYAGAFKDTVQSCYMRLEERLDEIKTQCKSDNMEIWLEDWKHKDIFRNAIAVTKPYKGNRKDLERPPFLQEAKEYLVNHLGANLTSKFESEDMCLIRATELGRENCIIAFIDKDLLQAPFDFYNYSKKEHISLTPKEAEIRLYRQILTGDRTDNIPGLFRVGPKYAERVINEFTENIPLECARVYKGKEHTYDYLVEQTRLIYLIRERDEMFEFPISREEYNAL